MRSVTPQSLGDHAAHVLHRARTSSARPPLSAWMKLACFSETWAVPRRKPFSPAASISRPAESPAGLVNTEPALDPPGWCSRRHRTMAATAACSAVGRSRRDREVGRHHHLRTRGPTRSGSRRRGAPTSSVPAGVAQEVDPAVADEARRHVRAVAPGVHAHGAADRARHAHRPRQPDHRRRPPGGPARAAPARRRPARTELGAPAPPAPAAGVGQLRPGEAAHRGAARPRRTRRRPPAGWSPARSRRPGERRGRRHGATQRGRTASRSSGSLDLDEERGRAADAVGGQRARAASAAPARARASSATGAQRPGRGVTTAGDSSSSSGSVVRSPAPGVRQRSPGPQQRADRPGAARPSPARRSPAGAGPGPGRRRRPAGPRRPGPVARPAP